MPHALLHAMLVASVAAAPFIAAAPARAAAPPDWLARFAPSPPTAATAPLSTEAASRMLAIPAGSYPMGRADGPAAERPPHRVTLAAFRIDRTEVTNAAFAEFLNALRLRTAGEAQAGRVGRANLPDAAEALMEGREGSGL